MPDTSRLRALGRMLVAWRRGEYRSAPWRSLGIAGLAVIYLLAPFDLIPDAVVIPGLLDDAALFALLWRVARGDIDRFLAWEAARAGRPTAGSAAGTDPGKGAPDRRLGG
jgi:uncharacterized membrane protein YkvA (DUF1232 family)